MISRFVAMSCVRAAELLLQVASRLVHPNDVVDRMNELSLERARREGEILEVP